MLENLLTLLPINCNKKKGVITHTKAAIVIETYALHTFIDIETYASHRHVTQLAKKQRGTFDTTNKKGGSFFVTNKYSSFFKQTKN